MPTASCCRASTTPPPGLEERGGAFEVGSGVPSPPRSPPLAAQTVANEAALYKSARSDASSRKEGAAYTITEECERLFCDVMTNVFLVERNGARNDSLDMGVRIFNGQIHDSVLSQHHSAPSSFGSSIDGLDHLIARNAPRGHVKTWIELWDYRGGAAFRGFIAENEAKRDLFVFFTENMANSNLKHGLMALLEFASDPLIACESLVICLDRQIEKPKLDRVMRDLDWVGFELMTLNLWASAFDDEIHSPKWLFLSMEV